MAASSFWLFGNFGMSLLSFLLQVITAKRGSVGSRGWTKGGSFQQTVRVPACLFSLRRVLAIGWYASCTCYGFQGIDEEGDGVQDGKDGLHAKRKHLGRQKAESRARKGRVQFSYQPGQGRAGQADRTGGYPSRS